MSLEDRRVAVRHSGLHACSTAPGGLVWPRGLHVVLSLSAAFSTS